MSQQATPVTFEVRIWQHVRDPLPISVSARAEGGGWGTLGTIRLLLDDGHSSSGNYRYGDIAIAVPVDSPLHKPAVAISPEDEDVPRRAVLTIAFRDPPPEIDSAEIVAIPPPTEGRFLRADERTLLLQPAYPGWLRGSPTAWWWTAGQQGLYRTTAARSPSRHRWRSSTSSLVRATPTCPRGAQILVQFNRSVVPLTVLEEGPPHPCCSSPRRWRAGASG